MQQCLEGAVNSHVYDVMLQTEPHVDGHFDNNFVTLKKGERFTATFIPYNKKADMRHVGISVKTLNEVMNSNR